MKRFLFLLILLLIAGCGNQLNEEHQLYLEEYGWTIQHLKEEQSLILESPEEVLANFDASGVYFLRNYQGQQVTQFHYELIEKDIERKNVQAIVIESNGEIIGGYLTLQSWTPGVFKLTNKEKLVDGKYVRP